MTNRKKLINPTDLGKVPPQAIDLEEAVLAALLIDNSTNDSIQDIKPEIFYLEQNQLVMAAIKQLYLNHKPIDVLTTIQQLREMGKLEEAGGQYYITTLTNSVTSAANMEYHLKIVEQKHLSRTLIEAAQVILSSAYNDDEDVFEIIDRAEKVLFNSKDAVGANVIVKNITDITMDIATTSKPTDSIDIKFDDIDRFHTATPGDLIVIAGRPGMGKSSYALWEARKSAEQGYPVAYFSFEMFARSLVSRMAANSGIPYYYINNGSVDAENQQRLYRELSELQGLDMYFVDDRRTTMSALISTARRLVKKNGVKRVYIDQLSLVRMTEKEFRDEYPRLTEICRLSKIMAGDLNVPVTLLAQIGRAAESRGGDKKPQLSDLKSTGAIEEYADNVGLLWRPEYYLKQNSAFEMVKDYRGNDICSKGYVELNWAKLRNEDPDVIGLTFDAPKFSFTKFKEQRYNKVETTTEKLPW